MLFLLAVKVLRVLGIYGPLREEIMKKSAQAQGRLRRELKGEIASAEARAGTASRRSSKTLARQIERAMGKLERSVQGDLRRLDLSAIGEHVEAQIGSAAVRTDPFPHLDPKRVLITVLLYLPRERVGEKRCGTRNFPLREDVISRYLNTCYLEDDGVIRELVETHPFRRNRLMAFINFGAGHGADIPSGDAPSDLERYADQFYIALDVASLKARVRPPSRPHRLAPASFRSKASVAVCCSSGLER